LTVGDINGDGKPDIAASAFEGVMIWIEAFANKVFPSVETC
jgi:hypothetical protein